MSTRPAWCAASGCAGSTGGGPSTRTPGAPADLWGPPARPPATYAPRWRAGTSGARARRPRGGGCGASERRDPYLKRRVASAGPLPCPRPPCAAARPAPAAAPGPAARRQPPPGLGLRTGEGPGQPASAGGSGSGVLRARPELAGDPAGLGAPRWRPGVPWGARLSRPERAGRSSFIVLVTSVPCFQCSPQIASVFSSVSLWTLLCKT